MVWTATVTLAGAQKTKRNVRGAPVLMDRSKRRNDMPNHYLRCLVLGFALSCLAADAPPDASVDPQVTTYLEDARALMVEENYVAAATAAEKALELLADSDWEERVRALTLIGDAELELGNPDAAIEGYEEAQRALAKMVGAEHPRMQKITRKLERARKMKESS